MSDTSSKLASGAILMLLTRLIVNLLGIISSLILVRILSPEDFGVAAIAMSIYAFISLFGEFGFNTALIQKNTPVKSDYDAAFTVNFIFGILASLAMLLASESLSSFFNEPRLEPVFYVLASLFFINGCKNIKIVDFQINMDFAKELKLQVLPKFLSFFLTLFLAYQLQSYWALVYGTIFLSLINIVFSYMMIAYKPTFTLKGSKALFNYSKWLMLNNFFYYINNKSIDLLVGKLISTSAAGIYNISKEMATLPSTEIAAPINKASFPAYSKEKNNPEQLRELFYKTTSMITIIALPASMGLFMTADYFVPVVLGEKWLDAIPVVQLLSLFAFFSSISSNNGYVFLAIGKPKITTFISGIRILSFFIFLYIFDLTNSVEDPAEALVYTAIANMIVAYVWLKYEINISLLKVIYVNFRSTLSTLIMCLVLFVIKQNYEIDVSLVNFLSLVIGGVFTYSASLILIWIISGKPNSIEKHVLLAITKLIGKIRGKV
ncbi:lipopolysaccharide biosynthesis protein [Psychrosphaera sp. B3R10]|uniref:lipopolysaccharide biosynthesis protein n=1 Tax=unclassified Psychrosphaera TaxID=2641570 RepID=UPI001C091F4F|nr:MULTISPECIES: lipopolysaccharide biosynthesis protein [unclassified Psychrosphaera]MBU2883718.1 lipopolysaccharide biosynthesis protein [Psychrosphaera sp. I2R16]MBU2987980.1 lipopolysaccharide biosynthesis protein [Psychrosphaera sp. B3R10]